MLKENPMKAERIIISLFVGSVGGNGRRKCLAEVFCGSVVGGDCGVCADKFVGSVRRKKPEKTNYVTRTLAGISFNTHV